MGIFNRIYFPGPLAVLGGIGLLLLYGWSLSYYPVLENDLDERYYLIFPLIGFLVAYCLSFTFYLLGSRKKLVYDLLTLIWFSCGLWGIHIYFKSVEGELIREKDSQVAELRQELRISIARKNQERLKELQDRLERSETDRFAVYEGRIPLEDLVAIKELDDEIRESLQASVSDYSKALDNSNLKGLNDWLTARTMDELSDQRRVARELLQVSRALLSAFQSIEPEYEKRINELELSEAGRRVALAERQRLLNYFSSINVIEIRESEPYFLESAISLLTQLIQDWGSWSYDYRLGEIQSKDPQVERRIIEKIQNLIQVVESMEGIESE